MLELVVVFCLKSSPAQCKERPLLFLEENVTPMQLMSRAQVPIAQWIEEHPGYYAHKWSVQRAGLFAKT